MTDIILEHGEENDIRSEQMFDNPVETIRDLEEKESVCIMDSFWNGVLTLKETVNYLESKLNESAESGEVGEVKKNSETDHQLKSILHDIKSAVTELDYEIIEIYEPPKLGDVTVDMEHVLKLTGLQSNLR